MPVDLGQAMLHLGAETSGLQKGLAVAAADAASFSRQVQRDMDQMDRAGSGSANQMANNVSGSFKRIVEVATGISLANIGERLLAMPKQLATVAFEAVASYERLGLVLETLAAKEIRSADSTLTLEQAMSKAKVQAQDTIQWVEKLAVESPFTSEGVAQAFRMAQAYGFTGDEAKRLTQAMIDFASGSGATEASMARIAMVMGQIKAAGRLLGQDMMQLTSVGMPVMQILADYFKTTTAEIVNMREKGLIPAKEAVEAITAYMETNFAGAAKRQATSWAGLVSTIQDLKTIALRDFFTPMFTAVQPYVIQFTTLLGSDELRAKLREIGSILGDVIGNALKYVVANGEILLTLFKNLLTIIVAVKAAAIFAGMIQSALNAAAAVRTLGAALAAVSAASGAGQVALLGGALAASIPVIGLVVTAVALLAAGLVILAARQREAEKAARDHIGTLILEAQTYDTYRTAVIQAGEANQVLSAAAFRQLKASADISASLRIAQDAVSDFGNRWTELQSIFSGQAVPIDQVQAFQKSLQDLAQVDPVFADLALQAGLLTQETFDAAKAARQMQDDLIAAADGAGQLNDMLPDTRTQLAELRLISDSAGGGMAGLGAAISKAAADAITANAGFKEAGEAIKTAFAKAAAPEILASLARGTVGVISNATAELTAQLNATLTTIYDNSIAKMQAYKDAYMAMGIGEAEATKLAAEVVLGEAKVLVDKAIALSQAVAAARAEAGLMGMRLETNNPIDLQSLAVNTSGKLKTMAVNEEIEKKRLKDLEATNAKAAADYQSKMEAAASAIKSAIGNALSEAQKTVKDLLPDMNLGGMGGSDPNGPFRDIFRAADVAKLGDASPWAKQLGLTQEDAKRIVSDFAKGFMTQEVQDVIGPEGIAKLIDQAKMDAAAKKMTEAFIASVAKAAGVSTSSVSHTLLGGTASTPILPVAQAELDTAAKNVVTGMATAIDTNSQPAKDAMARLATGMIDQTNTTFGSKSPSTVFATIGGTVTAGLTLGLVTGWMTLLGVWQGLVAQLAPALLLVISSGLSTGLDTTPLATALGAWWQGVMAIVSVNAVTWSAALVAQMAIVWAGLLPQTGIDLGVIGIWLDTNIVQPVKTFLGIGSPSTLFAGFGADIVAGLWQGITTAAATGVATVTTWLDTNLVQPVKTFLGIGSPSTLFAGFGGEIVAGLIKGVETAAGSLLTAIGNFIDTNVAKAVAWVEELKTAGGELVAGLKEGITAKAEEIKTDVATWVETNVAKAIDWAKNLVAAGGELIDGLKQGISNAAKSTSTAVVKFITDNVANAVKWVNTLVASGGNLITGLKTGIGNMARTLATAVEKFITDNVAKAVDWLKLLVEAGEQIVAGLKQGIKNKIDEIRAQVEAWAASLPAWMRKYLGIGSPSKVFAEIGGEIVAGLAQGIETSTPISIDALANMIKDLLAALEQGLGGADVERIQAEAEAISAVIETVLATMEVWQGARGLRMNGDISKLSAWFEQIATELAGAMLAIRRRPELQDLLEKDPEGENIFTEFVDALGSIVGPFADMLGFWEQVATTARSRTIDVDVAKTVSQLREQLNIVAVELQALQDSPGLEGVGPGLAAFAADLGATLTPFANMLDFWAQLNTLSYLQPKPGELRFVVSDIIANYNEIYHLLAPVNLDNAPHEIEPVVAQIAADLGALLAPFAAMLDFWARLNALSYLQPPSGALYFVVNDILYNYAKLYDLLSAAIAAGRLPHGIEPLVAQLAADLGALLTPFAAMLDFWEKLNSLGYLQPKTENLSSVVKSILEGYGEVVWQIQTWVWGPLGFTNVPPFMVSLAASLGALVAPFSAMLDFWAKLNANTYRGSSTSFRDIITSVLDRYAEVVWQLQVWTWSPLGFIEVPPAMTALAASLGALLAPFTAMIAFLKAFDTAIVIPSLASLKMKLWWMLSVYSVIVTELQRASNPSSWLHIEPFTKELSDFATSLSGLLAPFTTMISFLKAFDVEIVIPSLASLKTKIWWMLAVYSVIVTELTKASDPSSWMHIDAFTQELVDFTSRLGGLLAPFTAMLAFWTALNTAAKVPTPVAADFAKLIDAMLAEFGVIVTKLQAALLITPVVSDEVSALAARLGGLVAPFTAMLGFWTALNTAAKVPIPAESAFGALIDAMLVEFGSIVTKLQAATAKIPAITTEVTALATGLGTLVAPFQTMLAFWTALAKPDWKMPDQATIESLFTAMLKQFAYIAQLLTDPAKFGIDMPALTPEAITQWTAFGTASQAIFQALTTALTFFKDLALATPTEFAVFQFKITALIARIAETFTVFLLAAKDAPAWTEAATAFGAAITTLSTALKAALDMFIALSGATGLPSFALLQSFVAGVLAVLQQTTIGMAGLKGTLEDAVGALQGALQSVNTAVTTLLGQLQPAPAAFTAIGAGILQGLAAGVIAYTQTLVDAVLAAIAEAIAAANTALGIASPSTVFAAIGTNVGAGLAQGILSGIPDVNAAVAQLRVATNYGGALSGLDVSNERSILIRIEGEAGTVPMDAWQFTQLKRELVAAVRLGA
jgi:tape measure domain-containing protein